MRKIARHRGGVRNKRHALAAQQGAWLASSTGDQCQTSWKLQHKAIGVMKVGFAGRMLQRRRISRHSFLQSQTSASCQSIAQRQVDERVDIDVRGVGADDRGRRELGQCHAVAIVGEMIRRPFAGGREIEFVIAGLGMLSTKASRSARRPPKFVGASGSDGGASRTSAMRPATV